MDKEDIMYSINKVAKRDLTNDMTFDLTSLFRIDDWIKLLLILSNEFDYQVDLKTFKIGHWSTPEMIVDDILEQ